MPSRKRKGFTVSAAPKMRRRRVTAKSSRNTRTGGFLGLENKFVDYERGNYAIQDSWTGGELDPGTPLCLSAVAQGDGASQRDGRKYEVLSVHLQGYIAVDAAEAATAPHDDILVRLALVVDSQTNAAQLAAENVYDDTLTLKFNGFRNLQYSSRFRVLKVKKLRLPVTAAVMSQGAVDLFAHGIVQIPWKMDFTFKVPLAVTCVTTAATIAAIQDNSIHLVGISTSSLAKISYTSRCRFHG